MNAPLTLKTVLPPVSFVLLAGLLLALAWGDVQRWNHVGNAPAAHVDAWATEVEATGSAMTGAKSELAGLTLFGQAAAEAVEAPPPAPPPALDESALPESAAGYQLFGIIEADQRERGRAILAGPDGEQREYRVGDTMPDGAQIHAVRERAVIFERNGALERLALPATDTGEAAMTGGGRMSPTPSLPNAGFPNVPGMPRVAIPGFNGMPSQLAPPMPPAPPDEVPAPIAEMPLESPPVTQ